MISMRVTPLSKQYEELSEFAFDLRHSNQVFLNQTCPSLMERNPVLFWKSVSFVLTVIIVMLLSK